MKNRAVKWKGEKPSETPQASMYADIEGQGKVPYGKTSEAPVASCDKTRMKVRGAGAAVRGVSYWG
mgnify:CR=1 FL=1